MSATLHLPLDHEQLPELWQLKALLQEANDRTVKLSPDTKPLTPKQIEAAASWVFTRLFVALGYQARSHNRPGFLPTAGALQFRAAFEPYFGDDCNVVELLEGQGQPSPLLRPVEGGWWCDMFARENPHLAGNFKAGHEIGNVNSRVSAAYKNIVGEAAQQALMLLPGFFKRHDGEPMGHKECEQAIILIRALDRVLGAPAAHAHNSSFSEGIMAAASKVLDARKPPELMPFYFWVANHANHPVMPKRSEEILADFEKYFSLMRK